MNKEMLKNVPNYYKIINFDYEEGDILTEKLIKIYQNFVFNINLYDEDELNKAREFDMVLNKYVNDYAFRKEMKKEISNLKINKRTCTNILTAIIDGIIAIFHNYEEFTTTKSIYISKWI